MQRARSFFYVCAGVFLLVLVYHLGARDARGGAMAGPFALGDYQDGLVLGIFPNGDVYQVGSNVPSSNVFSGNAAGRTVVSVDGPVATASSGEIFYDPSGSGSGPWSNLGVPPGWSPVAANRQSLGQVKARYR